MAEELRINPETTISVGGSVSGVTGQVWISIFQEGEWNTSSIYPTATRQTANALRKIADELDAAFAMNQAAS